MAPAPVSVEAAIPVEHFPTVAPAAPSASAADTPAEHSEKVKMTKICVVFNPARMVPLKDALVEIGVTGMTITQVMGCGVKKGSSSFYRGVPVKEAALLPKVKLEVIVTKIPVADVVDASKKGLYTGHLGDGKIFVYDVENVIKIRTGEEGFDALQGD